MTTLELTMLTRRQLLQKAGGGFGMIGLSALLHSEGLVEIGTAARGDESDLKAVAASPMAPRPPHFPARAKNVIWVFVNGGPSPVDTWDFKPALARWDGKSMKLFDPKFKNTTGFFKDAVGGLMKSPFAFTPRGECGKMVSEIFPHLGKHVDKMAFIHSAFSESNNHSPALFMMNTGFPRMGYPCVGSWVTYGLGSESQNLPGFVVMSDPRGRGLPKGHAANWGAAFLPGAYQGTHLKPTGMPIDNLERPSVMNDGEQRGELDLIHRLGELHRDRFAAESELTARIESFELAYRMQSAAPEAIDVDREPAHIKSLYGLDDSRCDHFGRQCLTARRMIERGVRFVQIYHNNWDTHFNVGGRLPSQCRDIDQPCWGLIHDLKARGLLDETLVIWGGEFGRTIYSQGGLSHTNYGRDHHPRCFTMWMAGGGSRPGTIYGETDEFSYNIIKDPVHIHDFHATVLHLLGFDHQRFTFKYQGLEQRLTGVEPAHVIKELLA
jgi:Protein of unknown function (DUF1501)